MSRATTYLPEDVRPFLSPAEAADLLGLSRSTIIRRIASGELDAVQTAPSRGRYRIPRAALVDYLERSRA